MIPKVSIVMSVYDNCDGLWESVESVLNQSLTDLELIIVDDGSTLKQVEDLLQDMASRDERIILLRQPANAGLTKALIRGCEVARGTYIARIDAGDQFVAGKLEKQLGVLESSPNVALVSCWTRFVLPGGEWLFDEAREEEACHATALLRSDTLEQLKGVSAHGSVMFRKEQYEQCGGYRKEFYFAQDLDLWQRLTELGLLEFIQEVLFVVEYSATGISGRYCHEQRQLAELSMAMMIQRKKGASEAELLATAKEIRPVRLSEGMMATRRRTAGGELFIGDVLSKNSNPSAWGHYKRALVLYPFSPLAYFKCLRYFCNTFKRND